MSRHSPQRICSFKKWLGVWNTSGRASINWAQNFRAKAPGHHSSKYGEIDECIGQVSVICAANLAAIQYPVSRAATQLPSNLPLWLTAKSTPHRNSADSLHSYLFVPKRKVKWKIYWLSFSKFNPHCQVWGRSIGASFQGNDHEKNKLILIDSQVSILKVNKLPRTVR